MKNSRSARPIQPSQPSSVPSLAPSSSDTSSESAPTSALAQPLPPNPFSASPESARRRPSNEQIAQRAYENWQRAGGSHGEDQRHWYEAERELTGDNLSQPETRREEP